MMVPGTKRLLRHVWGTISLYEEERLVGVTDVTLTE